mgnify:CR=1 FL=1
MDLSVDYLGKHFENPFILSSGPPTASIGQIKRAFEAGWAGAVIKTLYNFVYALPLSLRSLRPLR